MAKVLSVRNPWASLILLGKKTIELRTWNTSYRGRLYIHISQRRTEDVRDIFGLNIDPDFYPRGEIHGSVEIYGVKQYTNEQQLYIDRHLHRLCHLPGNPNLYGWQLRNPQLLIPGIPMRGQLGLWNHEI